MFQLALRPGLPGGKWACLRPLCGHDEAFVTGTGPVEAIALLDRLLVEAPGTAVGPGKALELAVCDCDRLFAALYLQYFGERIEGTVPCRQCRAPFELSFSLRQLMANLENRSGGTARGPDEQGVYTLPEGRRFRLPTAGDLQSVLSLDAGAATAALLERCVVKGDPTEHPESLQAALDEAGAVLDVDLEATCAECGATQSVRFDIQSWFVAGLAREKRFLHHEVHRIAMSYGWAHEEILDLTREDRRAFVRLIEADRAVRRKVSG